MIIKTQLLPKEMHVRLWPQKVNWLFTVNSISLQKQISWQLLLITRVFFRLQESPVALLLNVVLIGHNLYLRKHWWAVLLASAYYIGINIAKGNFDTSYHLWQTQRLVFFACTVNSFWAGCTVCGYCMISVHCVSNLASLARIIWSLCFLLI